jgi:serine beta-lactamase-like protein LACTB
MWYRTVQHTVIGLRSPPRPAWLVSVLILVLVQAFGSYGLKGQVPALASHTLSRADIEKAINQGRPILEKSLREQGLPGIQVAVSVGGHVVWSEGLGYANVESQVPVTPVSKFRVGSVAKSITAAAIGRLVELGQLDLDAVVQTYVPSFPEKRWPITTRQLGGHLSGIRHYRDDAMGRDENLSDVRYETVLDGLVIFKDDPLLFEPETGYSYSSYAWNLIGAVIESASDRSFLQYMREQVFEELNLWHTQADWTDSLVTFRTNYYDYGEDGRLVNSPYVDNSYKWAGGGFVSTAEDLVRFADAHSRVGFFEQATLDLLFTSQKLSSGEETGYGIGWSARVDDRGRKIVSHGGGSVGGSTMLILYPEERVSVALISNISGWQEDRHALSQQLAQPFLEALALHP